MKEYKVIKQELKARRNNINYFTPEFYNDFVTAYRTATNAVIDGIETHYRKDGIILNRCYDSVYNSRFYQDNSGTYCEFLSVFYGNLKAFVFSFYRNGEKIRTCEYYHEDAETAKKYADAIKAEYKADFVEVDAA